MVMVLPTVSRAAVPDATNQISAGPPPSDTAAPQASSRSPRWLRVPSSDALGGAFPRRAQRDGVLGRAVLACEIGAQGDLTNCAVQSETPPGYEFGKAALSLVHIFKITAQLDGQSFVGERVVIPIGFRPR